MNQNLNALLSAIRALLITIGTLLAANGLAKSGLYFWTQLIAGSVMVVGPAVWGVWSAFDNWRKASAVGVAAGINLTTSGQAVDHEGNPISKFAADATPPKDVTQETAAQIVRDFAPTAPIAKA